MSSLTSVLQQNIRNVTGTTWSFTGDIHAYMDAWDIGPGDPMARLLSYVSSIDATVTTANEALNYALQNPSIIV